MLSWISNLIGLSVPDEKDELERKLNKLFQSQPSFELLENELPCFLAESEKL